MLINFFGSPIPDRPGRFEQAVSFLTRSDVMTTGVTTAFSMAATSMLTSRNTPYIAIALGFGVLNFINSNISTNAILKMVFSSRILQTKCLNTKPDPEHPLILTNGIFLLSGYGGVIF